MKKSLQSPQVPPHGGIGGNPTTDNATPLTHWHDNYEVMAMFHISLRTLQTLRSNGKLPFARIGGRCYYKESDLQRLMDESYRDSRMKGGGSWQ